MKKTIITGCLFLLGLTTVSAQEKGAYKEKQPYKNWVRLASKFSDEFFNTAEAVRIADNVLLYQHTTGGWPKNIYMPAELNAEELEKAIASQEDINESTIDNGATVTEIRYLSRTYLTTGDERYKQAVIRGVEYLLNAQYANGGWPQFFPRPKGYYTHITYNDNAMVNVMLLLREIYEKKTPYTFLPEEMTERARTAFDKGVDCILKTQVVQNGKLTVWCAQHDEHTLLPAKARAYELPSLSGQESDEIVLLLMSLPNPSPEVVRSVDSAIEWFKATRIEGLCREFFTDASGKRDYRMVQCADGEPLWARFYTLEDNRPFFCDRDGVKRFDISEIGHERRNGYSWYNNAGTKLIEKYERWKKKLNK